MSESAFNEKRPVSIWEVHSPFSFFVDLLEASAILIFSSVERYATMEKGAAPSAVATAFTS